MRTYVTIIMICFASPVWAQNIMVQSMSYDACVQSLQTPPAGALQPPEMTVDTDQVKEQRVHVPSGLVTVRCTSADQTVTLTHSNN
jgi:hypothetical protein